MYGTYTTSAHAHEKIFEVQHIYGETYVMDLDKCTCTCRRWELTGLACCHAIACISLASGKLEDYAHKCYSREAYLAAYESTIAPISSPNVWKTSAKEPVLPPKKMDFLEGLRKQEGNQISLKKVVMEL